MKREWKNWIKSFWYLMLIMLLLLSSLPLMGVFAENMEESLKPLDAYLFDGNETVTITENDDCVINSERAFLKTYFVTLDHYYDCVQNLEGNHFIQATYLVSNKDTVIQSGELMLGNSSGDSFQIEYDQTGEYTIEIKASGYETSGEEYIWMSGKSLGCVTDTIEKKTIQLQKNIEKEGCFSYRDDYGRNISLSFFSNELEKEGDIGYTVSSTNETVIKVASEQELYFLHDKAPELKIMGVGQAELIIQPVEHDFYTIEKLVIPITVANSSMRDGDYTIIYTDTDGTETVFSGYDAEWQDFLSAKKNWLCGSVTICLSETGAQYYAGLGASLNNTTSIVAQEQLFTICEEAPLQQYDFWCSNLQNNTVTKNQESGIRTFSVGIDRTAPINTGFSYTQNIYEPTSTEMTYYYGEDFVVSGSFEDAVSGIERIEYTTQADLGEDAEWHSVENTVSNEEETTYDIVLNHGSFTGIAVRAIDVAGNISDPVEIKNENGDYLNIIVDKTTPILSIMLKTADDKDYQGEWTNQSIFLLVKEKENQSSLSGIQQIQYQYVSIGGEYQLENWTDLSSDGILKIEKTNKNGNYYFRAITNTGIMTSVEAQKQTAARVRLQQTLPQKKKIIETAPLLKENQTWYSKKTGVPFIEFTYPEYDNGVKTLEYGAPITIHTRLSAKHSKQEEMKPVEKIATIGILNDNVYKGLLAGETSEVKSDELEALNIDFSYDKQSGYAKDGIYELEYWITDEAGNESEHDIYTYQIDTHEPEMLEIFLEEIPMKTGTESKLQYEYFYPSSVNGKADADFGISGKGSIKLMLAENIGDWEHNHNWINNDSYQISPCMSGCVYMLAEDAAGNQASTWTRGIIVDNQPPTGDNGGKFVSICSKPNDNGFYHDDIEIQITANDLPYSTGYSALESVSYMIHTKGKENKQEKELFSFSKDLPSKEELDAAKSFKTVERIDAATFEGNEVLVEVTAKDRCGNVATCYEELKIDMTKPQVEITFDENNAKNGCYYQNVRIATIQVKELNFDSQGVEIKVTKNAEPSNAIISEWNHDGINHYATVSFAEDGDYTMTVTCKDLADNCSEEVSVEPFTIDLTKPVIEIDFDNNNVQNTVYYRKPRTATIKVKEHNFQEEDFVITSDIQFPVSEWSHKGDEHSINITFSQDNHYYFTCSYIDLAGNKADVIEEQDFYIDTIAPQISIRGVEDGSANAGEITPTIHVFDSNANQAGVQIAVTTGKGDIVPLEIQMQETEQGYSYILTNMSEKEDNVYFLRIVALDMAGNESELAYRFSLNRNGSTYDLSDISEITRKKYNRFEELPDLHIVEMNVDRIESYSIYITRNGKMLSCKEVQERPSRKETTDEIYYSVQKSGDEIKGYSNQYTLYCENFSEEGIYRITCYSKDRAGNEINNTLEDKQAEICFVIDNTAPKVVIDGIETGGIYNTEEQQVNIMVQDNFKLEEARFTLLSQEGEELQSWDYLELAKEMGETVTITIPSMEKKQSLIYTVMDAAGNEIKLLPDTEEMPTGFLITTNKWLQFINSPAKLVIVIVLISISCSIGIAIINKKNKGNKVK